MFTVGQRMVLKLFAAERELRRDFQRNSDTWLQKRLCRSSHGPLNRASEFWKFLIYKIYGFRVGLINLPLSITEQQRQKHRH